MKIETKAKFLTHCFKITTHTHTKMIYKYILIENYSEILVFLKYRNLKKHEQIKPGLEKIYYYYFII